MSNLTSLAPGFRPTQPTSPAGQTISATPQGVQWVGVAVVAGLFAFFYWGTRAETQEEKDAYQQYRKRRAAHA